MGGYLWAAKLSCVLILGRDVRMTAGTWGRTIGLQKSLEANRWN